MFWSCGSEILQEQKFTLKVLYGSPFSYLSRLWTQGDIFDSHIYEILKYVDSAKNIFALNVVLTLILIAHGLWWFSISNASVHVLTGYAEILLNWKHLSDGNCVTKFKKTFQRIRLFTLHTLLNLQNIKSSSIVLK